MGTRWRALLAPINAPTGDGRRFERFTNRALPLPHRWQREDSNGHDNSVVVGLTDAMAQMTVADAVDQGWISAEAAELLLPDLMGLWGQGEFFDDVDAAKMPRLAQDVAEAMFLADKGVLGPSVGAGSATYFGAVHPGTRDLITEEDRLTAAAEGRPLQVEDLFTDYDVAESTMVPVPAFGETAAPFELLPAGALTAAVAGLVELPVADRGMEWDGAAAKRRVFEACTDGAGTVDVACVSRAFLWRDPDADPTTMGAYSLGFADMVDGELRIVPRGVAATAGGRGVDAADIPGDGKEQVKTRICSLYEQIRAVYEDWPVCPFGETARSAILAAAAAHRSSVVYPASLFGRLPKDGEILPLTVEDLPDGNSHVYGYVAQWQTCHTGVKGLCTTAPRTSTGYSWFHRYPVDTDAGLLPVGRITTGYGRVGAGCTHPTCRGKDDHACDLKSLPDTIGHYDRLKTVAWARLTETPHGVWMSGVTAAPLTDADRRVLSRRKVSGDWRPYAGSYELAEVLALAVEEPGFPIRVRNGRQTALLAAGAVVPSDMTPRVLRPAEDTDLADRVAAVVIDRLRGEGVVPALVAAMEPHTGAMVALVPTEEHASRLAVINGLPAEELHVTLAYLGEADTIPVEMRERMVDMFRQWVDDEVRADYGGAPIEADAASVAMFNPPNTAAAERRGEPCAVLGLTGPDLAMCREMVTATLAATGHDMPDQYEPWTPHITLAYTDNTEMVAGLGEKTGPVEFDRLRVAFGGEVYDIPIAVPLDDEEMMDDDEMDDDGGEDEVVGLPPDVVMSRRAVQLAAEVEAGFVADEVRELLSQIG